MAETDGYDTIDGYIKYWETCDGKTAHLWKGTDNRPERWDTWLKKVNLGDKVLVDYGCGGAFIYDVVRGMVLRYIGLDIALRSVEFARERLKGDPKVEIHLLPCDLKQFGADILICQQVMPHLHNQEMLTGFIDSLNESGIKELMLEILPRTSEGEPEFGGVDVHNYCHVSEGYLEQHLKYDKEWSGKNAQYIFTKWRRKD